MRRLLQLGTFLLLSAVILAPVFELFDRWDAAGVESDTEIAVFGLVLLLCLLLAVCVALSNLAGRFRTVMVALIPPDRRPPLLPDTAFTYQLILPPIAAPLRI